MILNFGSHQFVGRSGIIAKTEPLEIQCCLCLTLFGLILGANFISQFFYDITDGFTYCGLWSTHNAAGGWLLVQE